MKAIVIDYAHSSISLSSAFAKKALIPGTDEYAQLQSVRKDFPEFRLVTRQFKTNTKQEHYRGLTYDYMRDYISKHEEDAKPVLAELEKEIGISKCHSLGKRYPTIKKWFLETYPAVAEFGMDEEQLAKWREKQAAEAAKAGEGSEESEAAENSNVTEMPSSDEAQKKADAESATVIEMPSSSDEEKILA